MTQARKSFYGICADICRALGRRSLVVPRAFDRVADWCADRTR